MSEENGNWIVENYTVNPSDAAVRHFKRAEWGPPPEQFILLREPAAPGAGHTAWGPYTWEEIGVIQKGSPSMNIIRLSRPPWDQR